MNEAETRSEHIDPALKAAGWGVVEGSRIRREYIIAPGRIEGHHRRGPALTADYVLEYRNTKLAVVEAKAWDKPLTEGVGQAKQYAGKMAVRFAYATNGQSIYGIDMETGTEAELTSFPTPEQLWNRTFTVQNAWRDRFAAVPFEDRGGYFTGRYYQDIAVERVLAAVADGQKRILLTLATGTGKTFIAFQIAWKLFQSRWNLGAIDNCQLTMDNGEGTVDNLQFAIGNGGGGSDSQLSTDHCELSTERRQLPIVNCQLLRRPRILFLADRNILADQAYNAFSSFPEDALVRISPGGIRLKERVPTNGSIFFTIFQTFMCDHPGEQEPSILDDADTEPSTVLAKPNFYGYPPDFFDFIIIDECHRGGANDESNWRAIMDYFTPAVQLGLTATPKRDDNVDTYAYFGDPVYVYSLKEGINDGFLTPFKVKQIATTLDEYIFTPDDHVLEGEAKPGTLYGESAFNRIIEIKAREKKRVEIFMSQIIQSEKTLVFCATQEHALIVRDLVNQIKRSPDPNYCQRVTANDGMIGEQYLRDFQDNEKTIPTILTTSQKLSTGVDARNIRNIVLMRPINSMIEFKQIIGRGTRLYDGKEYFTIYDFVKAHHHFSDPEWDGEPLPPENCLACGCYPCECEKPLCPDCGQYPCKCKKPCPVCGKMRCECDQKPCVKCGHWPCTCSKKLKVRLADGKERTIQYMMSTSYWHPDGTPISTQQFMEMLYGKLPEFFKNEQELREIWSAPDTRKRLLDGLSEKGFNKAALTEMQKIIDAEQSDLFDVLAHVAYALPTISRTERAASARTTIRQHFNNKQQAFLEFVLSHYVSEGVDELDMQKLGPLLKLRYHDSITDAIADLGKPDEIGLVFSGFQRYLYQQLSTAPVTNLPWHCHII